MGEHGFESIRTLWENKYNNFRFVRRDMIKTEFAAMTLSNQFGPYPITNR